MEKLNCEYLDATSFPGVMAEIDTFIFDADGVLWLGESVMPGSPALLDLLVAAGKTIIVLTNNATKSRSTCAQKLAKLGYHSQISKESIVNPAAVVADTLRQHGMKAGEKKVYLIGTQGIKDELEALGIAYFGDGPDPVENHHDGSTAFIYDLELEEEAAEVGAVVVGYERHFNYIKLMKAANYLRDERCLFVGTNEDETCPGPNPNTVIPDAGPVIGAVKIASGREPIVVGKPNTPAFEYICRRWAIEPQRTMMIGDRTNTDVKFGRDHGLKTCLVLSGCHQLVDILKNQRKGRHDMVPDYYAQNLGTLVPVCAQKQTDKLILDPSMVEELYNVQHVNLD